MDRQPSIKQMVNRANSGHRQMLRHYAGGTKADPQTMGELRGLKTVMATLRAWGCVDSGQITDRGRELLVALDERQTQARRNQYNDDQPF